MKNSILIAGWLALLLISCKKENRECAGVIEKDFTLTGFSRISGGENFNIQVTKDDAFGIKAKGCVNDIDDLELTTGPGNLLELKYRQYKKNRSRVHFEISLPQLVAVNFSGAATGSVNGFEDQAILMRNILSGVAECSVSGASVNMQVELSGDSKLELSGSTESLYGNISGNARLNSYNVTATEVDISASGTGKAFVKPVQSLFADASGESRIYYRGNPPVTYFNTSGNGRIIRE